MTPGEFRASELGMKALGLLPSGVDLKATMVRVYSEEIAAFYDTKTKTMHLIREPEVKKAPSFLERLMGRTGGFDKDENKTVIAHELTHALADQNYDIDAMQHAVKDDDDRSMALSALVEGEATLTMIGAQMSDWDGSKISTVPSADLDRAMGFMGPMMKFAGGAGLREAPPILVESLTFPYLRGLIFCARLTNDGGWPALNAAYARPPLSTEQILHPEKYLAKPDPPTSIDLGVLAPGGDWKEIGRNVVGEFQTSVLLSRQNGKVAAAGWDGDRFAVFERPDHALALVWATTWDTEADAREFAVSYARFQTRKLGPGIPEPDAFPDSLRRPHAGSVFAVERRGLDVSVVEGFGVDATDSLLDAAFRTRKSEAIASAPKPKP